MSKLDNVRRGELKRILRAQGVSEIEVYNKVEDILAERTRWTKTALGERVGLTFDLKIRLGIRTIACIDCSRWMMKEYYLRCKRERDRVRVKGRRKMTMTTTTDKLSAGAERLLTLLDDDWQNSTALIGRFAGRKDNVLRYGTLQRRLLRAANELCEKGQAEQKIEEPQRRGRPAILVRRSAAKSGFSGDRHARNVDEIRAARKGDSILSENQNIGQRSVASLKKCNQIGPNFNRENDENRSRLTDSLYDDSTERAKRPQDGCPRVNEPWDNATTYKLH